MILMTAEDRGKESQLFSMSVDGRDPNHSKREIAETRRRGS